MKMADKTITCFQSVTAIFIAGGELLGTPLLNQEGWRGRAGVVSVAHAGANVNVETPALSQGERLAAMGRPVRDIF